MFWIALLALDLALASLIYSWRFTLRFRVGNLDLVQFVYLIIVAPVGFLALANIGLDVLSRPEIKNLSISSNLVFSFYALSVCVAMIGTAIHSTSTTVLEDFPKGDKSQANMTNEVFHGPLSHGMLFLGSIAATVFLALLEINHPDIYQSHNTDMVIILGVILGLIGALAICRSTYIKTNLVASFFATIAIFYLLFSYFDNLSIFPFAVLALVIQSVMFTGLTLAAIIYLSSNSLTKKLIRLLFPDGHPSHG